jgi:biopolymer transport protein ExbD
VAGPFAHDDDEEREELAELNITPFIDVMLVLLIIFMVAAPLSTVDVPVELPTSTAPPKTRPEQPVFLTIDAAGRWSVGEAVVAPDDLLPALERATEGKRETRLFLRADKSVAYGALIELTDRLRAGGYLKLALVGLEGRAPAAVPP